MPLVIKLRNNFIVERKTDLEQAIINNLAVFFDAFPLKLEYEIKMVSSITTQDGSTQTGLSQQIKIGEHKNGTPKYKTVVNKFIVLDIFAIFSERERKKLTRLLIAPINILDYNPKVTELKEISENIFNLIKGELRTFGVGAPVGNEASPHKGWWFRIGFNFKEYKMGPYKTDDIAAQAINIEWNSKRGQGTKQIEQKLVQDEPDLPYIPDAKTWAMTIPGSMPATAPPVSGGNEAPKKPGENATTLLEWYQAQGQTLPTVALRALEYEKLGLGPKNTYIATGEQNTALLEKLKAK